MIILGLSPTSHESAVGLLVDGKLVAAASEERFTRVKNQGGFPERALAWVLEASGVTLDQVDHVAFAALPFIRERGRDLVHYASNLAYCSTSGGDVASKLAHAANFTRGMLLMREWESWGGSQRDVLARLRALGLEERTIFVDHHRAHCASAYYTSGFDRCLAVSLDGYGSSQAGAFYLCEGGRMQLLTGIPYPHSLGTFYRRLTQALGFKPNRHEGKIVGLAAFGDPEKLRARVLDRFDLTRDDYFQLRYPSDPFFERDLAKKHAREDVAAAYQSVLEEVAVKYVRHWMQRTGTTRVACAGGVFANVKMNQRIMQIDELEELFVYPSMGDGGVGVGAAFALEADLIGLEPRSLEHVYLGPSIDETSAERAIRAAGLAYRKPSDLEAAVVEHLVANRVVARADGAMEFGPRALGNRSILYPAVDPTVNKWLNDRLKRTEFMPFAPISLASEADALYADAGRMRHAAEFMTVTTDCTARMRAESPAAVHVDGTARPQFVRRETAPKVERILSLYHQRTGIPTLINTSFNMHEEPIVCTAEDAVRAFVDGSLEVLSVGPFLVERAPS